MYSTSYPTLYSIYDFDVFWKPCLLTSAKMTHARLSLIWYLNSGSLQKREKGTHCKLKTYDTESYPLWTFHLYVAIFQQHLHMEYMSPGWSDIPELVVPLSISLIEGCCWQGKYWSNDSYLLCWCDHCEKLYAISVSQMITNIFDLS